MLPGFSASSSLYRSSRAYAGYSASPQPNYRGNSWPGAGVMPAGSGYPCPPVGCATCDAEGMNCCYTGPDQTFQRNCYFGACCPKGHKCCIYTPADGLPPYFQGCFDLKSDANNCGTCSHRCSAGEICCHGVCTPQNDDSCGCPARACARGDKCCGTQCLNVTSDTVNCGSCGHRCAHLQKCVDGKCCFPKGDIAAAAALMCLLTLGSDCNAIYQQLLQEACP